MLEKIISRKWLIILNAKRPRISISFLMMIIYSKISATCSGLTLCKLIYFYFLLYLAHRVPE